MTTPEDVQKLKADLNTQLETLGRAIMALPGHLRSNDPANGIKALRAEIAALRLPQTPASGEVIGWRWRYLYKNRGPELTDWHIGLYRLDPGSQYRDYQKFEEQPLYASTSQPASGEGRQGAQPERETHWLVERRVSPPQYERRGTIGTCDFTADVWHAHRFKSEREACEYIRLLDGRTRSELFAVEHMFINKTGTETPPRKSECHAPLEAGQAREQKPICDCCQRTVDKVRGSAWHGTAAICTECFYQWYDPDNGEVDSTDPISIGNYVRKKHGLDPLPPRALCAEEKPSIDELHRRAGESTL